MRKGAYLPIAVFAIALLVASPYAAEAAKDETAGRWVLRVSPTWIESDLDDGLVVGTRARSVTGFDDLGLSVAGEYRFSPRLGLEVGLLATSNGVAVHVRDGEVVSSGTSTYSAFTVGPGIHLTPSQPADLYFGPFVAYAARTDVGYRYDDFAGVRVGGRLGWGAVLGIDVPLGERAWLLCASIRYLDTNLEATDANGDRFDLDLGPTAIGVGFGYRF